MKDNLYPYYTLYKFQERYYLYNPEILGYETLFRKYGHVVYLGLGYFKPLHYFISNAIFCIVCYTLFSCR